jgi:uncharacterized membrane protein
MTARKVARCIIGIFYLAAGVAHLTIPDPFLGIMPGWVPAPKALITATGIAELAGAGALLQPWSSSLRKAGAAGLALYAAAVLPANVNHMLIDLAREEGGLGLSYHVPRLVAQPVLIWFTLWAGGLVGRPADVQEQAPRTGALKPPPSS